MPTTARLALTAVLAALSCAGCTLYSGSARPASFEELRSEEGWILLDSVPYVPQVSKQGCGAACLAMVLGHWGEAADAKALESECAISETGGIRAAALRDAARRRGLSAFVFEGTTADLEHELSNGRPVVVGVWKPDGDRFTSHFEVVVGLQSDRGRIAALDPAIGLTCDSLTAFAAEWHPTNGVTLVVFRPEREAVTAKTEDE
jgi:ABC-type bacteriocin/lantibiotic exporter with double-glycine peptidase domain